MRVEPFGVVVAYRRWLVRRIERANTSRKPRDEAALVLGQRLGPVLSAVERLRDGIFIPTAHQDAGGEHPGPVAGIDGTRRALGNPPIELGAAAEDAEDKIGDLPAVLGADETVGAEIAREEAIRRPAGGQIVEQFNCSLGPGAWGHGLADKIQHMAPMRFRIPVSR